MVTPSISIPETELRFQFSRSSGPGGQNVNKVNSKALLYWRPRAAFGISEAMVSRFLARFANRLNTDGDFYIASDRFRDRAMNQDDCCRKLRSFLLEVLHEPIERKKKKPSFSSHRRRQESKRLRGQTKAGRKRISTHD